jgi:hypothetical protein
VQGTRLKKKKQNPIPKKQKTKYRGKGTRHKPKAQNPSDKTQVKRHKE